MKRREFITLGGAAAATWPLSSRAQQSATPVVGFVNGGSPEGMARPAAAFRSALSEAGYVEGQNVTVEYHWLEGNYDRIPALVADLVRRRVAVIAIPGATPAAIAAKAATTTIPIVFGIGDDPVKLGLVTSLAQPGGNVTGTNFFFSEVASKRLGLLRDLIPKAARIAVLVNPTNASNTESILREMREAARAMGLQIQVLHASTRSEIEAAFATVVRERADALFLAPDAFFTSRPRPICHVGGARPDAYELRQPRDDRSRPADELRSQPCGHVPSGWRLYRQHPQGGEASRTAGFTVDQIRIRHQPANGQGAGH
jgi:ABC-type uncharacterized transport system substrate-binding protein